MLYLAPRKSPPKKGKWGDVDDVSQLGQKHGVIGPLGPAFLAFPAVDKFFNRIRRLAHAGRLTGFYPVPQQGGRDGGACRNPTMTSTKCYPRGLVAEYRQLVPRPGGVVTEQPWSGYGAGIWCERSSLQNDRKTSLSHTTQYLVENRKQKSTGSSAKFTCSRFKNANIS